VFGRDAPLVVEIGSGMGETTLEIAKADPATDFIAIEVHGPGGLLHAVTDWPDYAEQILAVLSAEPLLENTAAGYAPRPETRPRTKFETRGERLGHPVKDLVFRRRAAGAQNG